ncbi:MAG: HAD family hydrolase [Thermomicrobiales bacterium]
MSSDGQLQAILFDSGDTLVRPIGGEWFPGRGFRAIVASNGLHHLQWDRLESALRIGMSYLDAHHHLLTEEEECDQLEEFFELVLRELDHSEPARALAREIALETMRDIGIEPFPDAAPIIERLRTRGLRLGIISNAWPSLDRRFRQLGLRDYFDPFVISAQVGCLKPEARIYQLALAQLGLPPEQVLFVDNWPENVAAARALGMQGVVLARGDGPRDEALPWIASLDAIDAFLDSAGAA